MKYIARFWAVVLIAFLAGSASSLPGTPHAAHEGLWTAGEAFTAWFAVAALVLAGFIAGRESRE